MSILKHQDIAELPKGWKWTSLGEVALINPKIENKENIPSDLLVQFLPMKLVEEKINKIHLTETRTFSEVRKGSYTPFIDGDIIFAKVTPCMENGKVAVTHNLKNGIGYGSSEFHVLRSGNAALNKFLFYFVVQEKFRNEAQNAMTGAVGLRRVPKQFIESYKIPLPSRLTQHAIVCKIEELFSELDKGIEQLKTAQQQLKTYRQAVLKWAFEGKLSEYVRTPVRIRSAPHELSIAAEPEIAYGAESGLPEGWKWVKIEDVTISLDNKRKPINKEERKKRHGNIPYYGANGQVGWIDDFIFDEPLVCVVEDETFTGREIPFSYKITGKTWVNNHAHVLKPKDGLNIDFLNYQLFYYPFLRLTTGTTGRKKLTKNALSTAPIKICSLEEQVEVVQEIESRLSVADKMEESITLACNRQRR